MILITVNRACFRNIQPGFPTHDMTEVFPLYHIVIIFSRGEFSDSLTSVLINDRRFGSGTSK